jgi:hypothetical protein
VLVTQPVSAQVWLRGGPADGAIRPVECGADRRPPPLLMFSGGQLFVATSDEPVPATYATYELVPAPVSEELWPYQHVGTLTG